MPKTRYFPGRSLRPRSGGFQDIEDRVMTPRSAKINDEVRFAARPAAYAVSSEERPALSADNNDAKTKERVKRVKKDKLELYQKLHDATKEREHYVAERHRMLQNANMINFQGGGQNNVEKPIANWQELLSELRKLKELPRHGQRRCHQLCHHHHHHLIPKIRMIPMDPRNEDCHLES